MVLLWLTRRPLPLCAVGKGGRQKAQDKAQALTTAPVTGRLLRHLPYTLASLLFSAFYNVADTLFVSHGVGDLAAAGISVVFPLTVLQGAIAQMVGAGAGALVSPCLGQKDYRAAGRVTKSAMAFFYTTALGITCVCLLFRTPLLRLFGATAEILPYARTYFTILAAGNVFSTGFSSIIRAEGRMDYSLWIWLLPTGVNLLLDWLLIYRLHLGIAGAAWATVIAQAASFCMSVLFFTRFSCQQFRGVRADRATVGRILTLGLPTLVQMGSLSVVLVVMNGLLAPRAGTVGVAAFGYVSRLAEFALAPFSALCLAAAPIIGSSYGAGLHSRVRQTVVRTVQLGLVYAVVAVAVCYTLSGALLGIFTRDPAIVQFGVYCLRRLAPALLFLPPVLTVSAYFQSVNRAKSALVTAGARVRAWRHPWAPGLFGGPCPLLPSFAPDFAGRFIFGRQGKGSVGLCRWCDVVCNFGKGGRLPPLLIYWNKQNKKARPLQQGAPKGLNYSFSFCSSRGKMSSRAGVKNSSQRVSW